MTESNELRKTFVFVIFATVLFVFLAYALYSPDHPILDILAVIVYLGIIFACDKRYDLSLGAVILLGTVTLMHPLGIFGLYSNFFFLGLFGYDKIIHLVGFFAITYGVLDIQKKKTLLTYFVTFLAVIGLGSLNEINEFIGETYLGMADGGMFTMTDTLPSIQGDFQRFDSHFDMIFNLLGSASCIGYVMLKTHISKTAGKT